MKKEKDSDQDIDWKVNKRSVINLSLAFLFFSNFNLLLIYLIIPEIIQEEPFWFYVTFVVMFQIFSFINAFIIVNGYWPLYYSIDQEKIYYKPVLETETPLIRVGSLLFDNAHSIEIKKDKNSVTFFIEEKRKLIFALDKKEIIKLKNQYLK